MIIDEEFESSAEDEDEDNGTESDEDTPYNKT